MHAAVGILALLMAVVIGFLAVSQVSDLEDNLETVTSGALLGAVDTLTLWALLLAALAAIFALVAAFVWLFHQIS